MQAFVPCICKVDISKEDVKVASSLSAELNDDVFEEIVKVPSVHIKI